MTGRSMRLIGATAVACAFAVTASAQIPIVPMPLKKGKEEKVTVQTAFLEHPETNDKVHPVAVLTAHYNAGQGEKLVKLAIELLETWSCMPEFFTLPTEGRCGGETHSRFNFRRDYVLLSWVGTDYSGKRVVYRAGIHEGWKNPYNFTLPGLEAKLAKAASTSGTSSARGAGRGGSTRRPVIYEVFLSPIEAAEHDSQYAFTQQANAADALVQPFLAAATGPMFSSFGKLAGGVNSSLSTMAKSAESVMMLESNVADKEPDPKVTVQVGRVDSPEARAQVKVKDLVKQPPPVGEFVEKVKKLASRLTLVEARDSTCARRLAEVMAADSEKIATSSIIPLGGTVCLTGTSKECLDQFDKAFLAARSAEEKACGEELKAAIETENAAKPVSQRMTPDQIATAVEAKMKDVKPVLLSVDAKMRELVAAQELEQITGESTFSNTPRTQWSFGALTSYAFKASTTKTRVKVGNDNKLAADPLTRGLTMFVVNIAPWGYDDSKAFTARGFVRPFVGVVTIPDFGIGTGASFAIWRGIGVNVGRAWMSVPSLNDNDAIGAPPANPNDAFGKGRGNAWFVGASYNFPLK